jgi:hypothetical protein
MTPKQIVEKHGLDRSPHWNRELLCQTLKEVWDEELKKFDVGKNPGKFDAAVKEFRIKWNAISAKSHSGLSDGLWSFVWATMIVPSRPATKTTPQTHIQTRES